ncbi:HMG box transcription factor BBX [Bombina bombina]|uniref:HMG box transcription factor BBX n=1 Tax=Bombina bombina TaxID=8345 RepID=UPI00235AB562|nr:HMG box transcription factor BBX [Bombina bombina]
MKTSSLNDWAGLEDSAKSAVMKGSTRNKDHSTEEEGTGKRPKRKCLQWHPLLANKTLDFSEEEEEEEEEEDIDKYKDAFLKANPGYKWCPATNKPVKTPSPSITTRKKMWTFPSENIRDIPSPKKLSKGDEMPQLNFGIADPTQMGGLSMLLLAGEHALTVHKDQTVETQIENTTAEKAFSSSDCQPSEPDSSLNNKKSALFQFAEISSSTSHSDVKTPAKQCEKSALFQFAEISSNTSQMSSPEPTKHVKSALFDLAEISSSSSHSDSSASAKQCGTSALFQLAEMCVASEAVKIEISANVNSEDLVTVKKPFFLETEASDEEMIGSDVNNSSHTCDKTELSNFKNKKHRSHSPGESDGELVAFIKREKLKKKKKKNKTDHDGAEKASPKKTCKKRQSSESDIESVMYTIEAVAKGDWGVEMSSVSPSKKIHPAASPKHYLTDLKPVKKKLKSKEKKVLKDKPLEITKDLPMSEPISVAVINEGSCEVAESIKEESLSPMEEMPPLCIQEMLKPEDCDNNKKAEACGSRKSERSCKGALYKTLVSEGMLTSLRANVDRGKRNSGKGGSSDHEGCWSEDNWAINQTGSSGSKKLKKIKSKDESAVGLAKLEEEFEKKFNSLPQYSPVTFPRKKKKTGNEQAEQQKGAFQTPKKNIFHKIVSKYKHKKEKHSTLDKAIILEDKATRASSPRSNSTDPNIPDTAAIQEPLVGSQKRKARKNKITHLVRTVDGQSSSGEQFLEGNILPSDHERTCSKDVAYREELEICGEASVEQSHSITHDMPAVSAFFSLAALAEVAAMENAPRGPRAVLSRDGQKKEMSQTAVLISCADQ